MKSIQLYALFYIFLSAGCGSPLNQSDKKPEKNIENAILDASKRTAESAYQCKTERVELIEQNEAIVRELIVRFKNSTQKAGNSPAKIDLKSLAEQYYSRPADADLDDDIYGILTSEGFKTILRDTAELLEQVAHNQTILNGLMGLHESLGKKPGDKMAEMITLFAQSPANRNMLLGTLKTGLCENASNESIVDALMSLPVFWQLGPKIAFLAGSPIRIHAKSLSQSGLAIPESLKKFITLAQGLAPQQDICSMESLDAHQEHWDLVALLLENPKDVNQTRPLRALFNMAFRLYTMNDANHCKGLSYEDLKQETLKDVLLAIAGIIKAPLEWYGTSTNL